MKTYSIALDLVIDGEQYLSMFFFGFEDAIGWDPDLCNMILNKSDRIKYAVS